MKLYLLILITCGQYDVITVKAKDQSDAVIKFYEQVYENIAPPISIEYFTELIEGHWKVDGRTPIQVFADITKRGVSIFTELSGSLGTVIANELLGG